MIYSIFLAFSLSIDAFGIGISYGVRRIALPKLSALFLAIETFSIMQIFVWIGHQMSSLLPSHLGELLASAFLLLFGFWLFIQGIPKKNASSTSIIQKPSHCDKDMSATLEIKEALLLGLLLSLDSLGIGISVAASGMDVSWLPFFAAIFQILFLFAGKWAGKRLQRSTTMREEFWSLFSGIILIAIALIRIF